MKTAVFSTKPYDQRSMERASQKRHALVYRQEPLSAATAPLAVGCRAVCAFVNDVLDRPCLEALHAGGVEFIAMRCAGFNNIDLAAAKDLGFGIGRVPAYSPYAVAEHAVALILTLNRKMHQAHNRVQANNFALEGLLGFDLHGKTVGVVGTGKIGVCFVRIMLGFGCHVLAHDPFPSPEMADLPVEMVELEPLLRQSDVVSLHCPLLTSTKHLITTSTLAMMKPTALLINTSRGGLVDTHALVEALAAGHLGGAGLDVYENESGLFFEDRSHETPSDALFTRLLAFPNVVVTGHQAFFTQEALDNIAAVTVANLTEWEEMGHCSNAVH